MLLLHLGNTIDVSIRCNDFLQVSFFFSFLFLEKMISHKSL